MPGLGGFITGTEGASLRNGLIVSPQKYIRFNRLLTYNDGLLTEIYMKDRGLQYAEAIKEIDKDVAEINSSLAQTGTYRLGKVGMLHRIENGSIIMKEFFAGFLPENLGMPRICLKKLTTAVSAESPSTATIEEKGTISLDFVRMLKYAAMIVVMFILTLTIPNEFENTVNHASFSFDSLLKQEIASIKPVSCTPDTTAIPQVTEKRQEEIARRDTEQPFSMSTGKYHLIIASLTDSSSAEMYISEHIDNGFEMKVVEKDGKYRISAARFNSYKDALKYMDSIRISNPTLGKSWIMCK